MNQRYIGNLVLFRGMICAARGTMAWFRGAAHYTARFLLDSGRNTKIGRDLGLLWFQFQPKWEIREEDCRFYLLHPI